MARGEEYVFKRRDPIFSLSRPVAPGIETRECSYCRQPFEKARPRRWCEFCGQNMCLKCTRKRHFEEREDDKHNVGNIDLLCLKKFNIRKFVQDAQETCKKVEGDIAVKK